MSLQLSITQYSSMKERGAITKISADGDDIAVFSKQFDPSTGEALPDLVTIWSKTDIENQVAYVNGQLANFQQVLTDASAN